MFARSLAPIAAAASLAVACSAATEPAQRGERETVGVMTTLPLIWGEAADVGEILAAEARPSWVRQELEQRFRLAPLDTLDKASLAGLDRLVLAQPRPLAPAENVALDSWVRGGGRLLLFADPMLSRDSRYPLGDRRRPQDVALLSPILAHWGLELVFDSGQPEGERMAVVGGVSVPTDLAGSFRPAAGAKCSVAGNGVLARCDLGKGRAIVLADAAILDDPENGALETRRDALGYLIEAAFD